MGVSRVTDLMAKDESQFAFRVSHETYQSNWNTDERSIGSEILFPCVDERIVCKHDVDVARGGNETLCDSRYLIELGPACDWRCMAKAMNHRIGQRALRLCQQGRNRKREEYERDKELHSMPSVEVRARLE